MIKSLFYIFILVFFTSCGNNIKTSQEKSSTFSWALPANVLAPKVPSSNKMSEEKVQLGRFLFYDSKLSANQTMSCSSCHLQEFAFSDKNKVGIGSTGEFHKRNPQGLTNSAYYTSYTWANPSLGTLERQIIIPLIGDDPVEMGVNPENENEVLNRFKNDLKYQELFTKAFPNQDNPYTLNSIVNALASFIRTLNSFDSEYDKYLRGEENTMSESAIRGMNLFNGEKAECTHCHSGVNFSDSTMNEKSFFTNQFFHNIGLYNVNEQNEYPNLNQGLFELSNKQEDKGRFKAPILRNVELTSPYMHDGSIETLEEVIELHSNGGRNVSHGEFMGNGITNKNKSDLIRAKNFTKEEKEDLLNFLKSLTDHSFINNKKISNPFKD